MNDGYKERSEFSKECKWVRVHGGNEAGELRRDVVGKKRRDVSIGRPLGLIFHSMDLSYF
jgi:hypothetical protein